MERSQSTKDNSSCSRFYVKEGQVLLVTGVQAQERYLFLFNDLLIVAKEKSKRDYKLKEKIRLSEVWISAQGMSEVAESTSENLTSFVLGWPTTNFVARFEKQSDRDEWYQILKQYIEGEREREVPNVIKLRIYNKAVKYNDSISVLVNNTQNALDMVRLAIEEFTKEDTDPSNYQLWVDSGKENSAYPLHGHESPFGIIMSHVRDLQENGVKITQDQLKDVAEAKIKIPCHFILRQAKIIKKGRRKSGSNLVYQLKRKMMVKQDSVDSAIVDTGHSGAFFGQPLVSLCPNERTLPPVVQSMIKHLFTEGMYLDGIFRKTPKASTLRDIRERLDMGVDVDFCQLSNITPHVTASLFKEFLRNLPESVLPASQFDAWITVTEGCGKGSSNPQSMQKALVLINSLPPQNVLLLRHIVCLLHHLANQEKHNQMNATNLAICLAYSLCTPPPEVGFTAATRQIPVITELLIKNSRTLFGDDTINLMGSVPDPNSDSGCGEDSDIAGLAVHDKTNSMDSLLTSSAVIVHDSSSVSTTPIPLRVVPLTNSLSRDSGLADTQPIEEIDVASYRRSYLGDRKPDKLGKRLSSQSVSEEPEKMRAKQRSTAIPLPPPPGRSVSSSATSPGEARVTGSLHLKIGSPTNSVGYPNGNGHAWNELGLQRNRVFDPDTSLDSLYVSQESTSSSTNPPTSSSSDRSSSVDPTMVSFDARQGPLRNSRRQVYGNIHRSESGDRLMIEEKRIDSSPVMIIDDTIDEVDSTLSHDPLHSHQPLTFASSRHGIRSSSDLPKSPHPVKRIAHSAAHPNGSRRSTPGKEDVTSDSPLSLGNLSVPIMDDSSICSSDRDSSLSYHQSWSSLATSGTNSPTPTSTSGCGSCSGPASPDGSNPSTEWSRTAPLRRPARFQKKPAFDGTQIEKHLSQHLLMLKGNGNVMSSINVDDYFENAQAIPVTSGAIDHTPQASLSESRLGDVEYDRDSTLEKDNVSRVVLSCNTDDEKTPTAPQTTTSLPTTDTDVSATPTDRVSASEQVSAAVQRSMKAETTVAPILSQAGFRRYSLGSLMQTEHGGGPGSSTITESSGDETTPHVSRESSCAQEFAEKANQMFHGRNISKNSGTGLQHAVRKAVYVKNEKMKSSPAGVHKQVGVTESVGPATKQSPSLQQLYKSYSSADSVGMGRILATSDQGVSQRSTGQSTPQPAQEPRKQPLYVVKPIRPSPHSASSIPPSYQQAMQTRHDRIALTVPSPQTQSRTSLPPLRSAPIERVSSPIERPPSNTSSSSSGRESTMSNSEIPVMPGRVLRRIQKYDRDGPRRKTVGGEDLMEELRKYRPIDINAILDLPNDANVVATNGKPPLPKANNVNTKANLQLSQPVQNTHKEQQRQKSGSPDSAIASSIEDGRSSTDSLHQISWSVKTLRQLYDSRPIIDEHDADIVVDSRPYERYHSQAGMSSGDRLPWVVEKQTVHIKNPSQNNLVSQVRIPDSATNSAKTKVPLRGNDVIPQPKYRFFDSGDVLFKQSLNTPKNNSLPRRPIHDSNNSVSYV